MSSRHENIVKKKKKKRFKIDMKCYIHPREFGDEYSCLWKNSILLIIIYLTISPSCFKNTDIFLHFIFVTF